MFVVVQTAFLYVFMMLALPAGLGVDINRTKIYDIPVWFHLDCLNSLCLVSFWSTGCAVFCCLFAKTPPASMAQRDDFVNFFSFCCDSSFVCRWNWVILGTAEKVWPKVCCKGREGRPEASWETNEHVVWLGCCHLTTWLQEYTTWSLTSDPIM